MVKIGYGTQRLVNILNNAKKKQINTMTNYGTLIKINILKKNVLTFV